MNINELFQKNEANTNSNTDKTNLLKATLPYEFEYNPTTQVVQILGAAKEVALKEIGWTKTGNLILVFSYLSKGGRENEVRKFITNPYTDNANPKAKMATALKLKSVHDVFATAPMVLSNEDFAIDTFENMVKGILGKLTLPTPNSAELLVEFENELGKYTNHRASDAMHFIGKPGTLTVDPENPKNKMTLIVEEGATTPSSTSEDASLDELLNLK